MSVVVYRDGCMAADSRAYGGRGQVSPGRKSKIYRMADGSLLGVVSAVIGTSERYAAWVNAGADPAAWVGDKPDMRALWIKTDGAAYLAEDGLHFSGPIEIDRYAIGSGSDFATGAMAMGADAETAAAVACEFDDNSGGPIKVERL